MQRLSKGDDDDAVQALARVPLASFVAERTRQVLALRAAGDKDAARALAGRRRPTASAWVVNQLYWQARAPFDGLLAAADRMRRGDRAAASEHRDAMSTLRQRAAAILEGAGHGATEATLRRVTSTLAAIAVSGGFEPDLPGALTEDRDPPGFEAMATTVTATGHRPRAPVAPARTADVLDVDVHRQRKRQDAERLAAAEGERKRDTERKRRTAERDRLDARFCTARATRAKREEAVAVARDELRDAEEALAASRRAVAELERAHQALRDDDA